MTRPKKTAAKITVAPRRPRTAWENLSEKALLDTRLCDLGLKIEGSAIEPRVQRLNQELERRGFVFRPYVWFSTDWFTPDPATGFAIPFYLAHQRLVRLERSRMLEVEGGTAVECMKILRHETAHALDNAFRLRRRKTWRDKFGSASEPYRSTYTPDPTSRSHVLNLDYWYSQSHPLEDWAETFAVWLQPGSGWRQRYAGWEALEKLQFVDVLMRELAATKPPERTRFKEEPLSSVRMTLAEYYDRKRAVYAEAGSPALDGQLSRVFATAEEAPAALRAAPFLRKERPHLVRCVAEATGQHRYLLDHVVRDMVSRTKVRDLRIRTTPTDARTSAAVLLTALSTQFQLGAHPRYHR